MLVQMEILVSILSLIIACAFLAGLAYGIRQVLEWTARRNNYPIDAMPIHYHIFGVGAYFTVLILIVWFR